MPKIHFQLNCRAAASSFVICVFIANFSLLGQSTGPLTPLVPRNPPAVVIEPQVLRQTDNPLQPEFEEAESPTCTDRIEIHSGRESESPLIAEIEAHLIPSPDDDNGVIRIDVYLAQGCHLYSLTQQDPRQTRIDVAQSSVLEVVGPSQPARLPEKSPDAKDDLAEFYSNEISFFVPVRILEAQSLMEANLLVRINGMICSDDGFCLPVRDKILKARPGEPSSISPLPPTISGKPLDIKQPGIRR